ncbi:MAG: hypothetical protein JST81_06620 [Bacteroidetes bacterium]|jgi:hypothetical protein|nr:hypothetical protein [Bacteroidota bacterium]
MFRSLKAILFSLLLIAFVSSCDKEISVENGVDNTTGTQSGTAEYTLDGQPLPCTSPLISGNYIVGTELDITNNVVVNVNVTTIGTYTIATGLINGIRFQASGVFTSTGPQTITLFGTGTPLAAISGTYTPGTHGCIFTITPTTSVIVPVGPIYYSAVIDGTSYSETADVNTYANEFGLTGGSDVILSSGIVVSASPPPANSTEFYIRKGILHSYGSSMSNVTFKAFFSTGTYGYGASPNDGIEIQWIDEAGNNWSTNNGTAIQTGSNFNITSVEDEPGQAQYSVRVKATFNCRLYDGAGNEKILTNGQFTGVFAKL